MSILKSFIIILSLSYPNLTCSNFILPLTFDIECVFSILLISSSSKKLNILSAAAIMACNIADTCAIWFIGCVNCLLYCIKLWIFPTVIFPCIAKKPPSIAIATYPIFPIKFIIGCINPDKNCDFHADLYKTSFASSNFFTAFSSPLNAFTIVCPPYISSTWPFPCPK